MTIRSVCLIGGSGFIGRHVAELLSAQGISVRVPSRIRERAKQALILLPTVEVVQTDVHDPAALSRVIAGCDAVINCVGVLHDHPRGAFRRNHEELPAKIVAACREAGVSRLVHISALGASTQGPSEYLRSKARGEAEIMKARSHGIRTTVFRPSVVFGRGDSFLTLFASLVTLPTPVIPLAGAGARFQPVFVEDVARAVSRLLDEPAADGQCHALCGPRVYTLRELVEITAALAGVRRRILPLPGPLAWLQAFALEHLPGRLMSRDNLDSMRVDNVCGCAFPEILGFSPTPLEAVAPTYLGQRGERVRYNTLRERAGR